MKSKQIDTTKYLIRLDKDDEINSSLLSFAQENKLHFASFSGIGSAKTLKIAHFNPETKKYSDKIFKGPYEVLSLIGTLSSFENAPAIHVHISLADDTFQTIGGHLVSGLIAATCEIVLEVSVTDITRLRDEKIGLNLLNI